MIPRVLVIAGSDSGGGAGIQADIKTVMAMGGYATTAITAITAQNTLGVARIETLAPDLVVAQIDAVLADIGADAIKIGMLGSAEVVRAVADRLEREDARGLPLVFDPVMVASAGQRLATPEAVLGFTRLMARATVSTPNLDELSALVGARTTDEIAIGDAAGRLIEVQGAGAILVTGARLPGGSIRGSDGTVTPTDDLLFDLLYRQTAAGWDERHWWAPRISTRHDHGTGCTLASAIATGLAAGKPVDASIAAARDYVRAALLRAPGLGRGAGPLGHAPPEISGSA